MKTTTRIMPCIMPIYPDNCTGILKKCIIQNPPNITTNEKRINKVHLINFLILNLLLAIDYVRDPKYS